MGAAVTNAKALIAQGNTKADVMEVAGFPFSFDSKGACEHLKEDNSCGVYDQRPDICRVEKVWEKHHPDLSREQYYRSAAMVCNSMMVQAGVDDRYLIPIQGDNNFLL